jgi:hypothetical protein
MESLNTEEARAMGSRKKEKCLGLQADSSGG